MDADVRDAQVDLIDVDAPREVQRGHACRRCVTIRQRPRGGARCLERRAA
jgi:hypothetical protein